MKIATTIQGMEAYADTPSQVVSLFADTPFRYLDYDFGSVLDDCDHWFLRDGWRDEIQKTKAEADRLGIRFVQAHAPGFILQGKRAEYGISAAIRAIEACKILEISKMVVHSGFFPEIKYPHGAEEYFKTNAPYFQALIPVMEANDVHILFENTTIKHCGEGCYFPIYAKDLNAMVAYMNHPLFGAAWDVGHANIDKIDHEKEILELGSNLGAIHVHDNRGFLDEHMMPMMGCCDYDSLMRGLIQSGFDGYFTLEVKHLFNYHRATQTQGPLSKGNLRLKQEALSLMYHICKHILSTYGVYEE
ncbi:MAG: sugar phosphate isomerase/epimerase [Clostridia bacterium]|nr:sugar phosphate isomerase/epimerase [Clostridia bacterium]